MKNLSCHRKSQEVHSNTILKTSYCLTSQETSPPYKNKPYEFKDPNSFMRDIQTLMEKVKKLSYVSNKKNQYTCI